tara:strand:- start:657 stop:923 length:267 start_codon:yes stop_codon:yes gene_type:complete
MPKKKIQCLDLHGTEHDEADHIIEKFITDNFQRLPVKIITGYSYFFIEKTKKYAEKYDLGCYPDGPFNFGCWLIFESKWKFFLDNQKI